MSGLCHVYRRSCRGGRPIHPRVYEHVLEWNLASLRSLGVGRCLCIAMPLQALPAGATPSSREGGTPGFLSPVTHNLGWAFALGFMLTARCARGSRTHWHSDWTRNSFRDFGLRLGLSSSLTFLLSGRGFFRPTIPVRASKPSGRLLGGYCRLRSTRLFQETFGSSVLRAQKHVMANCTA